MGNRPMVRLAIALAVCLPTACGRSRLPDASWQTLRSIEGRFEVLMPGCPAEETETIQIGAAPHVIHKFLLFRDNKRELFMVWYMDFQEGMAQQVGSGKLLEVMAASVARDAEGTLQEQCRIMQQGVAGLEVRVVVPAAGIIRARVFVCGNRHYQVSAAMPTAKADVEEVQQFLESFRIVPPEAARTRPTVSCALMPGVPASGGVKSVPRASD
jgi:hypothetical protein